MLVKKTRPSASACLQSTIRASGNPLASTVASVIASGSLISVALASANHCANSAKGSSDTVKSLAFGSVTRSMLHPQRRDHDILFRVAERIIPRATDSGAKTAARAPGRPCGFARVRLGKPLAGRASRAQIGLEKWRPSLRGGRTILGSSCAIRTRCSGWPGASAAEIKSAFRKLAKKYHPDQSKEPKAKDRFAEVGSAYEILGDEKKRAAFDRGEIDAEGKPRAPHFEGFGAGPRRRRGRRLPQFQL